MRNTRRWKTLKLITWITTDNVTRTNKPPITGSSSCTFSERARQASPVPIDSEPVSPMMIRAGAAFHHKKPTQAPPIDMATRARSRAACTP